jgi:hypothetical protein
LTRTAKTNNDVLDITDLLADTISSAESHRVGHQLIDARQRLIAILRERVAHEDVDGLTALCTGRYAAHRMLHDISPLTRIRGLTGEPFNGDEVALIHAARALAALGLALVTPPETAASHLRVFRRWIESSGLDVPGAPVRAVPAVIDTPHASLLRLLADAGELDLLSLVWMADLDGWMRRDRSNPLRLGPSAQVLLDRGRQGQAAVLSLSRVPGLPAGLIPNPATMTLGSADAAFHSSLAAAWNATGRFSRGAVLWSLGDKAGPITRVTGESSSLGFAVLLAEQRRLSRPVLGPLTVRRLRPRTAIVGRVDPDAPHAASSVSGYDAKLSVVDESTRVVLPHADYPRAVEANHNYGDNAELVPVKTWQQAANAGRAVDRKRLLAVAVVTLLVVISATLGLYSRAEFRRAADARAAAADAAATALLERSTDSQWERMQLDVRAFRTRDGLDTRDRMRAWARQLRFAQVVVPTNRGDFAGVINGDGSAAITPDPAREDHLLAWDFTTSPPVSFSADVSGTGTATAAWLGLDVVAVSRSHGGTALWNVRTRQLLRQFDAGGDVLVGDPKGRRLGYGSAGAHEFHVVDIQRNTTETVRLPGELQRWGPRQAMLTPLVVVEGMLTSGELVVAQRNRVFALSRAGARPLDKRAYLAQVVDLAQGQAVVQRCVNGVYELFGLETSTVLATRTLHDESCDDASPAFTPDRRRVVALEAVPMPRGRPEPESYVVLGADSASAQARRVEIPVGYRLVRAAIEPSGAYRLILDSGDSLLLLRVPPPDAMEKALSSAQGAIVSADGRYLVLQYEDGRVECWSVDAHKLVGTAPADSAEFSQAGASGSLVISPNGHLLVTVHHDAPAKLWQLPDLHPLGEFALPAVSPTYADSTDPEEIGSSASFVTDKLISIRHGDGIGTWSFAPIAKLTETQILLPRQDAPGEWQIVLPDRGQVLIVRGNNVQRNRLSDGALVQGSKFSLGNTPSRDFQGFQPVVDSRSSLMAIYHGDAIEVWDLLEHKRVDRLHLADNTVVDNIWFGKSTDDLEFVLKDYRSKNAAGIITQHWHRGEPIAALDWLGFGRAGVEQAPDRKVPPVLVSTGPDGALEPMTPKVWLDQICRTLPDVTYLEEEGLPEFSWRGPICADR